MLIGADLGRAILLAAVPLAYSLDVLHIEPLYVVAFLVGVLDTFFGTAYAPFLLAVVQRDRLVEASAKLNLSGDGSASPWARGSRCAGAGRDCARCHPCRRVVLRRIGVVPGACARTGTGSTPMEHRQSIGREIVEGLRLVAGNALLRPIAGTKGTWEFFDNVVMAVLVWYLTRELGLSPAVLGLVFVGGPLGFLLGNLLAARAIRVLGFGPTAM